MLRMVFEKTGSGIWISHLDLMRVFQRAFRRAGLSIRHTQGYNPHAFVSLALPLSVGTVSHCELLEFDLEAFGDDVQTLPDRINRALPVGIRCLSAYEGGKKLKELTYLRAQVRLEYDAGIPAGAESQIAALFRQERLLVEKKAKTGPVEQDILPLLRSLEVTRADENTLTLEAVVCAQNPSLNPDQLAKAIRVHLPELAPEFSRSTRLAIYDGAMEPFR